MEGYGLSALGPTVGLSGLPDPMGDATAALEARRQQQVEGARAPAWMRDIGANIGNLAGQPMSAFIPPELRDRLPSAEMVGNLVLGSLPGSGDYMAARDAMESSVASMSALGRGDYMGAGARGVDALAAGLGIMPFLPYLASIKGVGKPIRAYHGSPHDFDRFDISKIGTGEGAQAYGHGLYFAENEGVARSYRAALAKPTFSTGLGDLDRMLDESYQQVARQSTLPVSASDAADLVGERLARQRVDALKAGDFPWFERVSDMQIALDRMKRAPPETPGRMYEVDIHADPERMLDLDRPLSRQADPVRDAAMKAIARGAEDRARAAGISGADVAAGVAGSANPISMFPNAYKGPKISEALRDAGIPGIRYLDQGSRQGARGAGGGSHNYVVFDDKLIEILRKYGIMAPMAGAGLGSLYLGDEEGM